MHAAHTQPQKNPAETALLAAELALLLLLELFVPQMSNMNLHGNNKAQYIQGLNRYVTVTSSG